MTIIGITILAALYFLFYKWGYKHGVQDTKEDYGLIQPPPIKKSDYK